MGARAGSSLGRSRATMPALALLALSLINPAGASAQTTGGPATKTALYELGGREPYRTAWKHLTAPVVRHERWLKGVRGVWSPAQNVTAEGASFHVFYLCKPTDCAHYKITVIFGPEGRHAYGALYTPAGTQLLGAPAEPVRRVLLKALHPG
ncbi:inhibitor of vertebrate lysozyme family protein [Starkeya koreensis]|uniref:Inhibitor of vertebrate lysozyme family protein n=1 Tax=Ancylobacter koreensis TaxID=266121 RepID=A0ABT0DLW7_9HYPH|nr:Ivy family c-type lysozyme inhibitor [Ancylobacter koreensis]MCK0208273.1 inhibitor of vertebrate lysozyme family protein [Ancylobacter koreensis]